MPITVVRLTPQQFDILGADIAADPVLSAYPNTSDGNSAIAAAYNVVATPAFTVWKSAVARNDVGKVFVASALAAITAGNNDKLNNFAAWNEVIFPFRKDQRDFFDDIFSVAAGATTRVALSAFWRRLATRAEKLLADTSSGNGSDATPATLVFEGDLSYGDVEEARRP